MLLADGMPVPAAAARHAAACSACAAQVALFRSEARALQQVLALDEEEHAFLLQSGLSARVAALVGAAPGWGTADARRNLASFGLALAALAAGYVGWLVVTPVLSDGLELARRAGVTTILVQRLLDVLISLLQSLWSALSVVAQTPVVSSPAIVALGLAFVAWLALSVVPWVTRSDRLSAEVAGIGIHGGT
jgi:hypothetical protein